MLLRTIRQYGGLAPFCSISESEHDIIGAGHASTSISCALGIREAMSRGAVPEGKVVAVIGDGALTGGVAFEALHNAGGMDMPIVIVINDNGMSIAPNVGALSRYFNRVRLNPGLYRAREEIEETLTRLPAGIGERIERIGPQLKESIRSLWAPGLFFEELDLAYVGVIDGHDIAAVREALRAALAARRPVVVHVRTVKGKGFAAAEDGGLAGMEAWHAAKPASIVGRRPAVPQVSSAAARPPPYTAVFGRALLEECRADERVCAITAAMNSGTGLDVLQKAMPDRYYDVGIAEQHAVLFAAGLALGGMKPVVAIYSTFLQRAFDQIVHDVCLQKLNVVFAMDRAGLVGDDGPTHHGAFDISYLRCLPNIVLMAPRDATTLVDMLHTALAYDGGPVALRYPRGTAAGSPPERAPVTIPIGRGEILRTGERVALLGYGSGVGLALAAADRLLGWHGLQVTVADARFAKPLDTELILALVDDHDVLVTVEENVLAGGFGAAVAELLVDRDRATHTRLVRVGLPDRYVTHGAPAPPARGGRAHPRRDRAPGRRSRGAGRAGGRPGRAAGSRPGGMIACRSRARATDRGRRRPGGWRRARCGADDDEDRDRERGRDDGSDSQGGRGGCGHRACRGAARS